MMKRFLSILLFPLLIAALLTGCGREKQSTTTEAVSGPQNNSETVSPAQVNPPDNAPEDQFGIVAESETDSPEAIPSADADTDMSETVDDYVIVVGEDQVVIFN